MLNADSKQLQQLMEAFTKAEQRVQTVLLKTSAGTVQELKIELNKQLDKVSLSLTEESKKWAESDLVNAYKEGVEKINGKTDRTLRQSENTIVNSYIELSTKVQTATENARSLINQAIAKAEKTKYGATVGNVKDIIKDTLSKENSSMVVKYANGAKMPLDAYAQMLARTSRIESSNTGSFDRCRKLNIDLVRCTTMPGCCAYCRMYEGKVYSISGNDKRFPALYETALQHGYNIMHPNCRHEFIPFVEDMQTEAELKKIIKDSNHFEQPSKDDVVIKKYNQDQATLRQWRNEQSEYNQLKAKLGNDMPYSTLGSFRRAKRMNSANYRNLVSAPLQAPPKRSKSSYKIIKEPTKYVNKTNFYEIQKELGTIAGKVEIASINNLDNANIVVDKLKYITQKYGVNIAKIDTKAKGKTNASAGYDELHLNPKYFNSKHKPGRPFKERVASDMKYYEDLKVKDPRLYNLNARTIARAMKELEKQQNYDRFTFGSESGKIEDTILHECGHLIHNQYFGLGTNGYRFRTDKSRTQKELDLASERRTKWQFEIVSRLEASKDIEKIGYYATTTYQECFAECFVAYETGRKLPKYVIDFFNDLFGGK